jgi:hypothetical protein
MPRYRSLAAALVAIVVVLTSFASSAIALPANFWGVVPQSNLSVEQLQRLKRGGATNIRMPVSFAGLKPSESAAIDWSGLDLSIGRAAEAGLNVLPYVYGAPEWVTPSEVIDARSGNRAPRNLPVKTAAGTAAWTAFLQEVVRRYGPNGSFWAANPAIPQRAIHTWQIWNEANFKYFVARPNPAEYGKLVKVSYTAIRGVDPGGKLILGGLFVRPKEAEEKTKPRRALFATEFLQQMYKRTPGIKNKFVGIALHPYTTKYQELEPDIEAVRNVLKRSGDPGKSMWITEISWSSGKPKASNGFNKFEKGPQGQAKQLKGAFRLLTKHQALWRIKSIYWYSVDDNAAVCNFCDGSGLFGPGFTPKPAWSAFVHFTGGTLR